MILKNVIVFLLFWSANASEFEKNDEDDDFISITATSKNPIEKESKEITKAKSILKELKERENLFSHNLLPVKKRWEAEPVFTKESLLFHSLSANYKGLAVPWWDKKFPLQLPYQGTLYNLKFCYVCQEKESFQENNSSYTVTKNVLSIVYKSEFHSITLTMKYPTKQTHWKHGDFFPDTIVDWDHKNIDENSQRITEATHNHVRLDERILNEMLESSAKFDLETLKKMWESIDMSESNREVRSIKAARTKASDLRRFYFLFIFPLVLGSLFTGTVRSLEPWDCDICLRQAFGLIYFFIVSLFLNKILG